MKYYEKIHQRDTPAVKKNTTTPIVPTEANDSKEEHFDITYLYGNPDAESDEDETWVDDPNEKRDVSKEDDLDDIEYLYGDPDAAVDDSETAPVAKDTETLDKREVDDVDAGEEDEDFDVTYLYGDDDAAVEDSETAPGFNATEIS